MTTKTEKVERPALDAETAKAAKPEAKRYVLWDDPGGADRRKRGEKPVAGLGLVVQPSGRKSFVFQFRLPGQPAARLKVGDFPGVSLDEARKRARPHRNTVDARQDPRDAIRAAERERAERRAAEELTVEKLAEEWRKYLPRHVTKRGRRLAKRSVEWYEAALDRNILPHLGGLPVAKVAAADATRMHEAVTVAAGPVAANAAAVTLAVFYNWLAKKDVLPAGFKNPGAEVKRHPVESRGEHAMVRLSREQEARLVAAIYDRMASDREGATALLVLLDTGRRKGEVLGMEWSRLDLDAGVYRINKSKSRGSGDTFYIMPRSIEAIRRLPRVVGSPFVFTSGKAKSGRRAGLQSAWESVRKAAGVESLAPELGPLRIHDLRHHRVSEMLAAGVSPALVARQCGWVDLEMLTRVYSHVEAHDVAAVLSRLAPVEPAEPGKVVAFPS